MLLSYARRVSYEENAILPEAGVRLVQLEVRAVPQQELDRHVRMLNLPPAMHNSWTGPRDTASYQHAPVKFAIPKATLTPGMAKFWEPPNVYPVKAEALKQPEGLVFVAVIQGLSAASLQKIHVAYSREEIANSIYHETVNGYSTVFSGAFFMADLERALQNSPRNKVEWEMANDLAAVVKAREESALAAKVAKEPLEDKRLWRVCMVC